MTQKLKRRVWKQIDLVVLPPKKGEQNFSSTERLLKSHSSMALLVTFWISVCPKINILPHDGKTDFFLVDAWKPIDLVVYHTRIVYRKGCWSHTHQWPYSRVCFGLYRVIFYTAIFTGLHNLKLKKFHGFFLFQQKK